MCLFAFDKICCPKFKLQEKKKFVVLILEFCFVLEKCSQLSQGVSLLLKRNTVIEGQRKLRLLI